MDSGSFDVRPGPTVNLLGSIRRSCENLLDSVASATDSTQAITALRAFRKSYIEGLAKPELLRAFVNNTFGTAAAADYNDLRRALSRSDEWRAQRTQDWRSVAGAARTAIEGKGQAAAQELVTHSERLIAWINGDAGVLKTSLDTLCTEATNRLAALQNVFSSQFTQIETQFAQIQQTFADALAKVDPAQLRRELENTRDGLATGARRYLDQVAGSLLKDATNLVSEKSDAAMRLVRAFGEPPHVPNLDFERPNLAYYFDEAKRRDRISHQ